MAGKKPTPLVRIQQLEKKIADLEAKLSRVQIAPPAPKIQHLVHFISPSGGIPARSTNQMGSALCDIYASNGTGLKSTLSRQELVYNDSGSAVGSSKHCIAARNDAGILVVILEDC